MEQFFDGAPIPSLAIPGQIDYSPRFAFAPAGG